MSEAQGAPSLSADKAWAGRDVNVIYNDYARTRASIKSHILIDSFKALIENRTKSFIGRETYFDRIDALLADRDFSSGYVLIKGPPGIGKTALMAALVRRKLYVHHFNIASQSITSTARFLANTCAQLIGRFGLDYSALPDEATHDSAFLSSLLGQAASRPGGEPVVVVVDALDEVSATDLPTNANRLLLPSVLPENVFVIVTMREQFDDRLVVESERSLFMDPSDHGDIDLYVREFVAENQKKMSRRLEEWDLDLDGFAHVLAEKSEGNFMYLVHTLNDVRDGRITRQLLGSLDRLPKGLQKYYKSHWNTMRQADEALFGELYEPVLSFLASAPEPVSIAQLAEWTGHGRRDVRTVLRDWREFLVKDPESDLYRIYHLSFMDFLADEVGLDPYRGRIVDTALAKIRRN